MDKKKKQQKAVKKAEAARDTAYAKQQSGGTEADEGPSATISGGSLATGGSGDSAPVTKLGATKSGKTLLGV